MKRDPRLRQLSADHHHALVLARRVAEWAHSPTLAEWAASEGPNPSVCASGEEGHMAAERRAVGLAEAARRLARSFAEVLVPHFAIEESLLLPALAALGKTEAELAQRTLADHQFLAERVRLAVEHPDASTLMAFSERLVAHIRMEERELFPLCERKLSSEILDQVALQSRR